MLNVILRDFVLVLTSMLAISLQVNNDIYLFTR